MILPNRRSLPIKLAGLALLGLIIGSLGPAPSSAAGNGAYVLDHTIFSQNEGLPPDAWRELAGIEMGPGGEIYVSDAFDGRITVLHTDPTVESRTLVRSGQGLVSPTHLALDEARDRLLVSDAGAGALAAVDLATGSVAQLAAGIPGASGIGVGPDGRIFVAASDNGLVFVYGPDGQAQGSWSAAPDDDLPGAGDLLRGMDVDADGRVYVVDGRRERVTVFDAAGQRLETIRPDAMAIDISVEYDPELSTRKRYWLATEMGLQRYDPRTNTWSTTRGRPATALAMRIGRGSVVGYRGDRGGPSRVDWRPYDDMGYLPERSWSGLIEIPGLLDGPLGIGTGLDGKLYLLDLSPRMQRFTADGRVLDMIPAADAIDAAGAADGRFFLLFDGRLTGHAPGGAALWNVVSRGRPVGMVYEPALERISVLDADGFVERFDARSGQMQPRLALNAPDPEIVPAWIDLALAGDGAIYALERRGQQVARIEPDGTQSSFPVGGRPRRISATPEGAVLTLGRDSWVRRYAPDGSFESAFDGLRFDIALSTDPVDLAVGPQGRVYLVDRKANLISRYVWDPDAVAADPPDDGTGCRNYPDKTASPRQIWLGETVDVRLTLRGGCGSLVQQEPLDIVLIMDESGSMGGQKIQIAREAARDFVSEVDLSISQVAVVGFDTQSRNHQTLSQDEAQIFRAIDRLDARGGTRIDLGLAEGRDEMRRRGRKGEARPIFVLLSDGFNNAGPAPVLSEAEAAKREGIEIYTIGIQADAQLMEAVASSPDHYFAPRSARFLYDVFEAIAQRITTSTLFEELTVIDQIPGNMRYIVGSAEPPADFDAATNTLTWTLSNVPFRGFALGYTLEPLEIGTWPTNVVAWGQGKDGFGRPGRVDFPVPEVIVIGPTATPSVPPPTPTPSDTPTPTPTPTLTPTPGPIYLPILLRERCTPKQQRADVILVLDASWSMLGAKLEAAKAAASRFVDVVLPAGDGGLAPEGQGSQVAVVGFNESAWLAQGLSDDPALLHAAIAGLEMTPGTRIDYGLQAAVDELASARRRPANTPTVVLLTDGLQNGSADPVYALAEAARAAGTLIYTVGLGADVDADFLAVVAGGTQRRYLAPEPGDLAAIYDEIAGEIPCPPEAYWGRRVGR